MRKTILTLALLSAIVAGCGSSSGGSASGSGSDASTTTAATGATIPKVPGLSGTVNHPSTKVASGGKVEIELDDKYFGPTYIKAKANSKLTIELKNDGKLPHNFTVKSLGINDDLDVGQTKTITLTVPATSTAYWCEYHQGVGMQGAFIVS